MSYIVIHFLESRMRIMLCYFAKLLLLWKLHCMIAYLKRICQMSDTEASDLSVRNVISFALACLNAELFHTRKVWWRSLALLASLECKRQLSITFIFHQWICMSITSRHLHANSDTDSWSHGFQISNRVISQSPSLLCKAAPTLS